MEQVTTEKKFLTEEEFKTLQEIQEGTQSVILELGQIELVKIQIEQRHVIAREFLEELSNKEKDFTQLIFEKYGKSNVDPTSGEIINLD
jgi:homogentisate 1,2-dioxygenase